MSAEGRKDMSKLERLASLADRAVGRLRQAKADERDAVGRPLLRRQVGRCFTYSNSYGEGERWPIYVRIVSFNEKDMSYETVQFQHTSMHNIEIEHRRTYNFEGRSSFGVDRGWTPIPLEEYEKARKQLLRLVGSLLA